jgi:hypothetical protein
MASSIIHCFLASPWDGAGTSFGAPRARSVSGALLLVSSNLRPCTPATPPSVRCSALDGAEVDEEAHDQVRALYLTLA